MERGISSQKLRPEFSPPRKSGNFSGRKHLRFDVFASCGDKNDGNFFGGSVISVDDALPLLTLYFTISGG